MEMSTQSSAGRQAVLLAGNAGERSEPEWTANNTASASSDPATPPDPEVAARASRRRFPKEYKLAILEEADRCRKSGQIGALLRREGLYSSHLRNWRRERTHGALAAMQAKKRGPKPKADARDEQVARLERENQRLLAKLQQAETVIDIQKKLSLILGIPLQETDGSDS
jgi:transposase-like protein